MSDKDSIPDRSRNIDECVELTITKDRLKNLISEPALIFKIDRLLRSYHLNTIYERMDVFNEVYVRANRQIKLGNNISNLSAWFSVVALNVIREWSRREQRQEAFLSSYEFYTDAYSVDSSAELMDLSDMLEKLDPADRELLISRARGKSWREIAQEFIGKENDKGNLQSVTSKLMQRHSRLIQRLRRQYRLNQSKNSNYPTADK